MSDRNLLELAAKAAGYRPVQYNAVRGVLLNGWGKWWNPLELDGEALQLAVALKMDISFYNGYGEVHVGGDGIKSASVELYGDDMPAITRRAVVRAAAEIGKSMP